MLVRSAGEIGRYPPSPPSTSAGNPLLHSVLRWLSVQIRYVVARLSLRLALSILLVPHSSRSEPPTNMGRLPPAPTLARTQTRRVDTR